MWWRVCSLLVWLPLQAAFPTRHTETLAVEEGQAATLRCGSRARSRALQWLAPSGYTIFLNEHPALKNSKYQLLHHSPTELSIRVSNVTWQDAGVYKCLHYGSSVRTKEVNLTVLVTPFKSTLEASVVRVQSREEHVVLRCSTVRSRPPPQITWQLGTDTELPGETRHAFEGDGRTCNSSSELRVRVQGRSSTAACVVRHPGLGGRRLVAAFRFADLVTDQETASDALETSPRPSHGPPQPASPVTVTEDFSTSGIDKEEAEQTTRDPDLNTGTDPQSSGLIRKKSGVLLLTLVSFLIFILFIIIQLFIMKLRKAHVIWKKENEISEHTLESYRSRSNNEEGSSQEKYGHTSRSKRCMDYITQLYSEAKTKRKGSTPHTRLKGEHARGPESIV